MEFNPKKHLYFQYNFRANRVSWLPKLLLLFFLSAGGVIVGFLLRGILSFLIRDAASPILQFVDLLLTGGLYGIAVSLMGLFINLVIFLVKGWRFAKKISEQDGVSADEYEETYQVEYKRIDEQDSTHH